ncbi:hypothetical protein E2C01_077388 [Portunus trituberculatus]|uniref:Uncharacterized protein n=1 Tax=Portunus trituberculatus TaxID=210409 RepID=A0A5B7IM00_PORTR|nr:hypothetical protein [Portunus trituberculatus]
MRGSHTRTPIHNTARLDADTNTPIASDNGRDNTSTSPRTVSIRATL